MAETYKSRSPSLPAVLRSPSRSDRKRTSPFLRPLRRFRRNRFWLLLFLWLAAVLPGLILHAAVSTCPRDFFSGLFPGLLFALAPAMPVFLLCTAMPRPGISYGISVGYTSFLFLVHSAQLISFQESGVFLSLRSIADCANLIRSEEALRAAAPLCAAMGLPLMLLLALGRQLFSFRPLKRWQQHIPMAVGCVLIHLLVIPWGLHHPVMGTAKETSAPPETVPRETGISAAPLIHPGDLSCNQSELDFAALASEASDAIAEIHRYFSTRTPSIKNGKTGLFAGCCLIQIEAEAFTLPSVSEELTPTLWNLTREGIVLTDYHAPEWGNSGSVYPLLTGSIPSPEAEGNHYLPLTMAQQLIRKGYSVFASSDAVSGPFLEQVGYEWTAVNGSLRDTLDRRFPDYVSNAPFHLFCTVDARTDILELDRTVELLLRRLDSADLPGNTALLITSGARDRGCCLMWKPGLEPQTVDAPVGVLDLLPTLSNLFGLEFDSRLYMGRDVFSDAPVLVPLPNRSWVTDLAMFDSETGTVTNLTGHPVTEAYIHTMHREVSNRFTVSARIHEYDYWRLLFE